MYYSYEWGWTGCFSAANAAQSEVGGALGTTAAAPVSLSRLHGRRLGPLQGSLIKHAQVWSGRGVESRDEDEILRFTAQPSKSSATNHQDNPPPREKMATEIRERGNVLYKQGKLPQGE